MAGQSPAQKETVARVMHEFKEGGLERSDGEPVRDPKQAIAIALREAGASNREGPATNKANLARTKRRERAGGQAGGDRSRAELYAEAARRGIAGRSRMNKSALERALRD